MKVIAKFLSEQFSQVPLLAADGSFVQYDKTAPILKLPHTHIWLAWEEMLQAPWKAVQDICDPRVAPSEKVRLASYSSWFTLEEEVPMEDVEIKGIPPRHGQVYSTHRGHPLQPCAAAHTVKNWGSPFGH